MSMPACISVTRHVLQQQIDAVVPDFRTIEGTPDVDLLVSVEEKSTGRAGFGAGYGASDGFNG